MVLGGGRKKGGGGAGMGVIGWFEEKGEEME